MIPSSRRFAWIALIILALSLAGCASSSTVQVGASWPGVTAHDGRIYLAYGSKVYAIDPENGEAIWAFSDPNNSRRTFYAPPAAGDNIVVVTDYLDSAFALNPETGESLWTVKSNRSRFVAGAALSENLVYLAAVDGSVYALNQADGEEVWLATPGGGIWSTPLVADGVLYVTSLDRHLYALDAETGDTLWQFPAEGQTLEQPVGAMVGTPTFDNGVLYFGDFNNHLYALDVETHQLRWQYEATNWVWSSPVIDPETGTVIGGDLGGQVFALDPQTGALIWDAPYDTGGPVVSAPTLATLEDGTRVIYVTSGADPGLYVLRVEDGQEAMPPVTVSGEFTSRFLFINTGTNIRPVPVYAPPVVLDGQLLVGIHQGNYPLIAFDRETMRDNWTLDPTAPTRQQAEQGDTEQPTGLFNNPNTLTTILIMSMAFLLMSLMLGRPRAGSGSK